MNSLPPHLVSRNLEPPRPLTARLPWHHNPGTDNHVDVQHFPILSVHWPNFPAPATEAERVAA